MFLKGKDQGYQEHHDWWYKGENAFRIANLNEEYPEEYFPLAEPTKEAVEAIVYHLSDQFGKITGYAIGSVLDVGCGGGWTVEALKKANIYAIGFDGSSHAIKAAELRVPNAKFFQCDFRDILPYHGPFSAVICTEVAEHIPPPFASVLVKSLCAESNFIWFSAEPPMTNRAHLHHVNEQPIEYWIALFKFFGYRCIMLPDSIHIDTGERGRCIFVNAKTYK